LIAQFYFPFIYFYFKKSVSVEQWKQQFLMWTTLKDSQISRFTSASKENVKYINSISKKK